MTGHETGKDIAVRNQGLTVISTDKAPVPLKSTVPAAPEFPSHTLPYKIAALANDIANRMQCPIDMVALPLLVTVAGCIGRSIVVRPKRKDTWVERACLWGVIISSKGSMKSPAMQEATAFLRGEQMRISDAHKIDLEAWEIENKHAKLRSGAYEKECKQVLNRDSTADLPEQPDECTAPDKPVEKRMLLNDATIEKVCDLMLANDNLTLYRDELSGFMLNMSRYNTGSDRQFYLECYSGGEYYVDRISRGSQRIPDLYMNIIGGIQPTVAKEIFSVQSGSDDGFFERFGLMAYPERIESWKHIDIRPDRHVRRLFNEMCADICSGQWRHSLPNEFNGDRVKPYVVFSENARSRFIKWMESHMEEVIAMEDDDHMSGMVSKMRGLVVRLAFVFHMATVAGTSTDFGEIPEGTLNDAIEFVETYLRPMWARVFDTFTEGSIELGARKILTYVLKNKPEKLTIRMIQQRNWRCFSSREEVEDSLELLADHRVLERVVEKTKTRPKSFYLINKLVYETVAK